LAGVTEKQAPKQDPQRAFVISQIGEPESPVRRRADEVFDYIVKPAVAKCGLTAHRSDHDRTPGQVTSGLIRSILESHVVIADMTGRNPNVYYELGVVHSFQRPVVLLVDHAASLSFDTQHERVIEIRDDGKIGVREAEAAAGALEESLRVVLADGYRASSLVTEVAVAEALDRLAPNDAVVSELASLRQGLDELRVGSKRTFDMLAEMSGQLVWWRPGTATVTAGIGEGARVAGIHPGLLAGVYLSTPEATPDLTTPAAVTITGRAPGPSPILADRMARRPRRRDKRTER
jgi:hypothetical protein